MSADEKCEDCRYWAQYSECRRHAPVTLVIENGIAHPQWPRMYGYEWCGDFERKPEKPA